MGYSHVNNWGGNIIRDPSDTFDIVQTKTQKLKILNKNNEEVEYIRDMAGFANSDYLTITDVDVITKAKNLSNFRHALLRNGSIEALINNEPEALLDLLNDMGISSSSSLTTGIEDAYDWENGKFKYVITKFDESRARAIKGDEHHYWDANSKSFKPIQVLPQLVFEVESNSPNSPNLQITVLDIHNQTTQLDFSNEVAQIISNPDLTMEIELGSDVSSLLTKFSNGNSFLSNKDILYRSKAIKGPGSPNPYIISLFDLENDTRGFLVSEPQVIGNVSVTDANGNEITILEHDSNNIPETDPKTGNVLKDSSGNIIYKKQLRGNAIVFISTDPNLKFPPHVLNGAKVTKETLSDYYIGYFKQQLHNQNVDATGQGTKQFDYEPKVNYYHLNSSSASNFSTYLENYNKQLD